MIPASYIYTNSETLLSLLWWQTHVISRKATWMIWYSRFIYVFSTLHFSKKQTRACHQNKYLESLSNSSTFCKLDFCCCFCCTHEIIQRKSSPIRKFDHIENGHFLKSTPLVLVLSHTVPLVLLGSFFQSSPHVGFAFFVSIFVARTFFETFSIYLLRF